MLVYVTKDEVKCDDIPVIHRGEFNVHEIEFIFSEEYEGLTKTAVFSNGDYNYVVALINNKCYIPNEILMSDYTYFKLGVYGYEVIDKELVIRYSPYNLEIPVVDGSYTTDTQDPEDVCPTQFEQYVKALNRGLKEIELALLDLENKVKSGYFDGKDGKDGKDGRNGTDGTAATIAVGTVTTGAAGSDASVTNSGTSSAAIFDFSIPRGDTGAAGRDGTDGTDGVDGFSPLANVEKVGSTATITITDKEGTTTASISDGTNGTNGQDGAAATIAVGTVTTGSAGSSATVTNSGTSSAAIFDFSIPKGDKGDTGSTGADGYSPSASVSKTGNTATITITDKNGTTTASVSDGTNGTNGTDGVGVITGGTTNQLLAKNSNTNYDMKWVNPFSMSVLSYGNSTWQDFITAYQNNSVILCRAASGNNPGTTNQRRLAFLAYVDNETNPTYVEFCYFRSVATKTSSAQTDEIYVYHLDSSTGWTWLSRKVATSIANGDGLDLSYDSATATATLSYTDKYNSTETAIGTWTDNSIIYRKCYSLTKYSTEVIIDTISDLNVLVKCDTYLVRSNGYKNINNFYGGSSDSATAYVDPSNNIKFTSPYNGDLYVVLEYTKSS